MNVDTVIVFTAMMVFVRAGGMLLLFPVFSAQAIPVLVRVGVAGVVALSLSSSIASDIQPPGTVLGLVIATVHELALGLLMGLAVRILFYAVELTGQIMATEIGIMMSENLDPVTRLNSSPVSTALFFLGGLLFFLTDAHQNCLVAFAHSFALAKPGSLDLSAGVADVVVYRTGYLFVLAVQMAAPLLAVNFIVNISFALLGKAAPTINVFMESFPVRIIAGTALLGLTIALAARYIVSELFNAPNLMLRFIH